MELALTVETRWRGSPTKIGRVNRWVGGGVSVGMTTGS
jgi:hypothetical protein